MHANTALPTTRQTVRSLLIVSRDHVDLYAALRDQLADRPEIRVILDRRSSERRQRDLPITRDQRRTERRGLPARENDLRIRQYLLTRPRYRRPQA